MNNYITVDKFKKTYHPTFLFIINKEGGGCQVLVFMNIAFGGCIGSPSLLSIFYHKLYLSTTCE